MPRFNRLGLVTNVRPGAIASLAEYCPNGPSPNLEILAANPYRVTFLSRTLPEPAATDYAEQIDGELTQIWVGSLSALEIELRRQPGD